MGGVKDFLFGKKAKPIPSESGNHAWDVLKGPLTPAVGYTTQGGNMMSNLLGLGGEAAQTGAVSNFANSGGMQFLLDEGVDSINANMYARGLGKSGSAMKALEKYRSGLASTYLNDYMKHLQGFSNLGLGAAGVLAQAGQYSKGDSSKPGKQGAAPTIISALSMIPGISDRRLKSNVVRLYTRKDGLNVYSYDLMGTPQIGVMADEVRVHRPDAFIKNIYGPYHGVDYSKLGEL